jgi:hypothetical protein
VIIGAVPCPVRDPSRDAGALTSALGQVFRSDGRLCSRPDVTPASGLVCTGLSRDSGQRDAKVPGGCFDPLECLIKSFAEDLGRDPDPMLLECACLPSFEPPEPPAMSENELVGGHGVGARLCWMTQCSCCANRPRMLMHPRITTGLLKTNSVAQDLSLLWGPTSSTLPQRRPVWAYLPASHATTWIGCSRKMWGSRQAPQPRDVCPRRRRRQRW